MSFLDKVERFITYLVFILYMVANLTLLGKDFSFKKEIIISLAILLIIISFFLWDSVKTISRDFIYVDKQKAQKKPSGITTLISCFIFMLMIFFMNINQIECARWSLLGFVIAVLINSALLFYDLETNGYGIFNKARITFGIITSIIYFISSAFASSVFLNISNMDLAKTPMVEISLEVIFFAFFAFLFLQPLTYFFFLHLSNKLNIIQTIASLLLIGITSIALALAPIWLGNFMVLSLDFATNFEWKTSAYCGQRKISNPKERYFGFHADKYTVYYSDRNGKWGFEEIRCIKNQNGDDSFIKLSIDENPMPKWFNDSEKE